jgi:hypothetical protein
MTGFGVAVSVVPLSKQELLHPLICKLGSLFESPKTLVVVLPPQLELRSLTSIFQSVAILKLPLTGEMLAIS